MDNEVTASELLFKGYQDGYLAASVKYGNLEKNIIDKFDDIHASLEFFADTWGYKLIKKSEEAQNG